MIFSHKSQISQGRGAQGLTTKKHQRTFWSDRNVFMHTASCNHLTNHQTVHLKYMHLTEYM